MSKISAIFGQNIILSKISAIFSGFHVKFRGRNFEKIHRQIIWNFGQFTKFRPSWQYCLFMFIVLGEVACKDFHEISNQSEAIITFMNQSKYRIPCVVVSAANKNINNLYSVSVWNIYFNVSVLPEKCWKLSSFPSISTWFLLDLCCLRALMFKYGKFTHSIH